METAGCPVHLSVSPAVSMAGGALTWMSGNSYSHLLCLEAAQANLVRLNIYCKRLRRLAREIPKTFVRVTHRSSAPPSDPGVAQGGEGGGGRLAAISASYPATLGNTCSEALKRDSPNT